MKISINKEIVHKMWYQIQVRSKWFYQFVQSLYQKLNMRQRIVLYIISILILLLLFVMFLHSGSGTVRNSKTKLRQAVQFETYPLNRSQASLGIKAPQISISDSVKLQAQLDQLKVISSAQYDAVKNQLQAIQASISSLASQQEVQQLKQTVSEPDEQLLGKINNLQSSLKKMIQQTEKKIWINPQTVERYFRLVAIQGFSDGMRAIVDVDGNQTTLSVEQICPACRGWVLHSIDFSHQNAVFLKHVDDQILYVKLQAN